MPQPTRNPVPIHGVAYRSADHKSDPWPIQLIRVPACVHHKIRLRSARTVFDGDAELRRPSHAVPGRKHATDPWVRQSEIGGPCGGDQ